VTQSKRPLTVTIVACLYLIVGIGGFAAHFNSLLTRDGFPYEGVSIETTELLALIAGVSLLRGQTWGRWLALAWIVFHVVLSFGKPGEFVIHCVFGAGIAWALFRPPASRYFRAVRVA
jgi:hypothetical protein